MGLDLEDEITVTDSLAALIFHILSQIWCVFGCNRRNYTAPRIREYEK